MFFKKCEFGSIMTGAFYTKLSYYFCDFKTACFTKNKNKIVNHADIAKKGYVKP
jgi:hypothetical protein